MQVGNHAFLPVVAVYDRRLSSKSVWLLGWLWLLADGRGRIYLSPEGIAVRCRIKQLAVKRDIVPLISCGYLREIATSAYELAIPLKPA